ncbi:MAG: hypothetical protein ACSW8C_05410 [bacterium]
MKKYKAQHKTLSFLVFHIVFVGIGLVFGITPKEVIESCAKSDLESGNVLAYYNRYNRIIVLKNGEYRKYCVRDGWDWGSESANMCQRVFEPTLAEIIAFSTGKPCQEYCHFYFNDYREYMSAKKIKMGDIQRFLELILEEHNDFSGYIIIKTSRFLSLSRNNNFSEALAGYCKDGEDGVNLFPLGNFRHTEVQLEALYRAYKRVEEYLKEKRMWVDYRKAENTKRFLENLLPVILTDPDNKDVDDHNIYSLYEACKVCRKVNWLQDKKGSFKFKVVDRQGQVERDEGRFYVLEEMATQDDLEAWQKQHKGEQASITSFPQGHFIAKPGSNSKDCESNKNKIENNF